MPRSRGRPTAKDGPLVTRQQLLEVAARTIGEVGLSKASMRGIARNAGISLGTLQHHFRTKEALWKAVIDELVAPAEDRPPHPGGPRAFFRAVVHERLGDAVRRPGLLGRVLSDVSTETVPVLEHLLHATSASREGGRALARAAIEAGALRDVDVEALLVLTGIALPMLGSSQAAIRGVTSVDLEDDEERARLADGLADILLYGLLPRD